jgi:peptidoglycan hydrolase CwlO-like protein
MMNKKIIVLVAVAALIVSIVIMNIQSASASTTYAEGLREGKAKGHSDAIIGRAADDRCG